MKSIRVRFNLSRGKNYMKWKIEYPGEAAVYYDATEVQLILRNCMLKNHKSTAKKIHGGANKSVCAWVLCEDLFVKQQDFLKDQGYDRVKYNPKVAPYWIYKNECSDGMFFKTLISIDNGLYCMIK